MAAKSNSQVELLASAQQLDRQYTTIGTQMPSQYPEATLQSLITGLQQQIDKVDQAANDRKQATLARTQAVKQLRTFRTGALRIIAGLYGVESQEYTLCGGTVPKKRVTPARRVKTPVIATGGVTASTGSPVAQAPAASVDAHEHHVDAVSADEHHS